MINKFLSLILVLVFSTLSFANKDEEKPTKKVEVITIRTGELLRTVRLLGRVEAVRQATLKAEAAGGVQGIHVQPGQQVEKGQLLLSIENHREKDRLAYAVSAKDLMQKQVDRLTKLSETGRTSQKELDEAKRGALEADRQTSAAEDALASREIRAPFTGEVGIFNVSEGGYVSIGETLVSVVDNSQTYVIFDVSETILPLISLKGRVEVDGVKGEITAIDPIVNPDTGMTKVKAAVDMKNSKPGQSVYVNVVLEALNNVIVIPEKAVFMDKSVPTVVVVKDGQAVYQPVQTGIKQYEDIEIKEGLSAGDIIVSVNPRRIYPDDKVEAGTT